MPQQVSCFGNDCFHYIFMDAFQYKIAKTNLWALEKVVIKLIVTWNIQLNETFELLFELNWTIMFYLIYSILIYIQYGLHWLTFAEYNIYLYDVCSENHVCVSLLCWWQYYYISQFKMCARVSARARAHVCVCVKVVESMMHKQRDREKKMKQTIVWTAELTTHVVFCKNKTKHKLQVNHV